MAQWTQTAGTQCQTVPWHGELSPEVRDAWQLLATRIPDAPVFHYPAWLESACRAGCVTPWQVVLVTQGEQPVGLVPLRRRTIGTAEILTHQSAEHPPLLALPGHEAEVAAAIGAWLRRARLGMVLLGRWHEPARLDTLRQALGTGGLHTSMRTQQPGWWLDLPASYDDYQAGLGRETRYNLRRREQQLLRDFSSVEVVWHQDVDACRQALEALIGFHRQRWTNASDNHSFADPRNIDFYRQLVDWAAPCGYLHMPTLLVEGRVITLATIFHLPGQRTAYYHCVARNVDALPARYSPGIVLMRHLVAWAIDRGITRLGLGVGTDYYKSLLGGVEHARRELVVAPSALAARAWSRLDPAIHRLHTLVTRR